jgi:uncharacterized protein YciI
MEYVAPQHLFGALFYFTFSKTIGMKKNMLLLWALGLVLSVNGQSNKSPAAGYEMKQYWFVMLTLGKDRDKISDTAVINKLQAGHMANINAMANAGKLLVAGPFGDDGIWRGIFIFDALPKEEVVQLLMQDPAIKAGRLDYEIHPWWTAKGTVLK